MTFDHQESVDSSSYIIFPLAKNNRPAHVELSRVEACTEILLHSCWSVPWLTCQQTPCSRLRQMLQHTNSCLTPECTLCWQVWLIFGEHSCRCPSPDGCHLPWCAYWKGHLLEASRDRRRPKFNLWEHIDAAKAKRKVENNKSPSSDNDKLVVSPKSSKESDSATEGDEDAWADAMIEFNHENADPFAAGVVELAQNQANKRGPRGFYKCKKCLERHSKQLPCPNPRRHPYARKRYPINALYSGSCYGTMNTPFHVIPPYMMAYPMPICPAPPLLPQQPNIDPEAKEKKRKITTVRKKAESSCAENSVKEESVDVITCQEEEESSLDNLDFPLINKVEMENESCDMMEGLGLNSDLDESLSHEEEWLDAMINYSNIEI